MDTQTFVKNGVYAMLALDHDASFKKMLNPNAPEAVTLDELIQVKSAIIRPLCGVMSGMLIDSEIGLPAYRQSIAEGGVGTSYLLRIEKSGYSGEEDNRINDREYTALDLKASGAQGVKLLLYINHTTPAFALQKEFARQVIDEAHAIDLPVFLEFVTYNRSGQNLSRMELMEGSLHGFISEGIVPDIWKLEYPESEESCSRITELVQGTPWILLSRGVTFDEFVPQMTNGARNGAQGFLVGRALWQEIGSLTGEAREAFTTKTLVERFHILESIFHP